MVQSVGSPDDSCTKMEFAAVVPQGESNVVLDMYLTSLFWKRKRGTLIGLVGSLGGRVH